MIFLIKEVTRLNRKASFFFFTFWFVDIEYFFLSLLNKFLDLKWFLVNFLLKITIVRYAITL